MRAKREGEDALEKSARIRLPIRETVFVNKTV